MLGRVMGGRGVGIMGEGGERSEEEEGVREGEE